MRISESINNNVKHISLNSVSGSLISDAGTEHFCMVIKILFSFILKNNIKINQSHNNRCVTNHIRLPQLSNRPN